MCIRDRLNTTPENADATAFDVVSTLPTERIMTFWKSLSFAPFVPITPKTAIAMKASKISVNGVSACATGQENYERFEARKVVLPIRLPPHGRRTVFGRIADP